MADKWRYGCPRCKSTNHTHRNGGVHCNRCGEWSAQLRDKKTGELVV